MLFHSRAFWWRVSGVVVRGFFGFFVAFVFLSLASFFLPLFIPGDPLTTLAGDYPLDPEYEAYLRQLLNLDEPLFSRYLLYIQSLLQGDWGYSLYSHKPFFHDFYIFFPATLELTFLVFAVSLPAALVLGFFMGQRHGTYVGNICHSVCLCFYSIPLFVSAFLAILAVVYIPLPFPLIGRLDPALLHENSYSFVFFSSLWHGDWPLLLSFLHHSVISVVLLSLFFVASLSRFVAEHVHEALQEDFVVCLRILSVHEKRILYVHVMRYILPTLITTLGIKLCLFITGVVVVENIFSYPGIGQWLIDSVFRRDYVVVQNLLLFLSLVVAFVHIVTDGLRDILDVRKTV